MSLYNPNYIHVSLDVDNFASHEDPIGEMLAVINKEMRIPFKEEREIKAVNGERVGFIGTEYHEEEEGQYQKKYYAERDKLALIRAELKGLREEVVRLSTPADERIAAMQERVDAAEDLMRRAAGILRG